MEAEAERLYSYADAQDIAGAIDENVANSFETSSFFFEMLANFGDVKECVKTAGAHAKRRAANIRACLKNRCAPMFGNQSYATPSGSQQCGNANVGAKA